MISILFLFPNALPEFIIFLAFNANNVWIEKISNLKATHAHECAGNMAQNFVPKATHSTRIQTKHKITIGKISDRMDLQFQAHYIGYPDITSRMVYLTTIT